MIIRIPITGTVINADTKTGSENDPIRLIDIDLGNVSWSLVELNLENEYMAIEVIPSETVAEDTGELDEHGLPIWINRPATAEEKRAFLEHARNYSLERMNKEALYALSKSPRLKNKKEADKPVQEVDENE